MKLKTKDKKFIHINITNENYKWLKNLSKKTGLSMSSLINLIISKYKNKFEKTISD